MKPLFNDERDERVQIYGRVFPKGENVLVGFDRESRRCQLAVRITTLGSRGHVITEVRIYTHSSMVLSHRKARFFFIGSASEW